MGENVGKKGEDSPRDQQVVPTSSYVQGQGVRFIPTRGKGREIRKGGEGAGFFLTPMASLGGLKKQLE